MLEPRFVSAGRQGLEPRYADPESAVLPYDDLPDRDLGLRKIGPDPPSLDANGSIISIRLAMRAVALKMLVGAYCEFDPSLSRFRCFVFAPSRSRLAGLLTPPFFSSLRLCGPGSSVRSVLRNAPRLC